MARYEISYAESIGGRMSESVEADQFDDSGEFIDFLLSGDGGPGPAVHQVLRIRAEHVDRIQRID